MGETQLKTIMITGVSRGLGRVLALELARRGHNIVGCARSPEKLQALMTELMRNEPASSSSSSSKHLLKHLDVRSDSNMKEFAKLLVEERKIPDIIGCNAIGGTSDLNTWFRHSIPKAG